MGTNPESSFVPGESSILENLADFLVIFLGLVSSVLLSADSFSALYFTKAVLVVEVSSLLSFLLHLVVLQRGLLVAVILESNSGVDFSSSEYTGALLRVCRWFSPCLVVFSGEECVPGTEK